MYRFSKTRHLSLTSAFLVALTHSTLSAESTDVKQRSDSFSQAKSYFEGITALSNQKVTHSQTNPHSSQTSSNEPSRNEDQPARAHTEARSRSSSQSSVSVPKLNHTLVCNIINAAETRPAQLDGSRTRTIAEYVTGPQGTKICHRLSGTGKVRISAALKNNPNSHAEFEGYEVGMNSKVNGTFAYYNLHKPDGSKIEGTQFMLTIIENPN